MSVDARSPGDSVDVDTVTSCNANSVGHVSRDCRARHATAGAVDTMAAMPAPRETDAEMRRGTPRWRRWLGSFWGQLVLAVVVIGLVLSFVAKPYGVPSASMEDTLRPGDRVLVNRLAYRFGPPKAGDVVVFNAGSAWDSPSSAQHRSVRSAIKSAWGWTGFGPTGSHTLVKRIIAIPGQKASCCSVNGSVVVDGVPLQESYLGSNLPFTPGKLDCGTTPRSLRCFAQVTVPEDSYLMLGDNRADSSDSAFRCRSGAASPMPESCWRWATGDNVVGKVSVALWPRERIGGVR